MIDREHDLPITKQAEVLRISRGSVYYGGMDEPEMKIIDVFICKLRKKLASASSGKKYIETVWGRGYVMRQPTDQEEVKISA